MKICLILPNLRWGNFVIPYLQQRFIPYGLCLLAAVIRSDCRYQVEILDAYLNDFSEAEFVEELTSRMPDIVGISVPLDQCAESGHRSATLVKTALGRSTIILGGPYVTANPSRAISDPNIDYIVMGEGEQVILPLLHQIAEKSLDTLPQGVYCRDFGVQQCYTPAVLNEKLDELPLPAFDLIDLYRYSSTFERTGLEKIPIPFMNLVSSRGCPYRCVFCNAGLYAGKLFRARSAEHVLVEVEYLVKEYGVRFLDIQDENFFHDKQRAKQIVLGIRKLDIQWMCSNVAVFAMDDELLELSAAAGCRQMNFAVESGVERVLHKIIRKPIRDLQQVRQVVQKANAVGIFTVGYFVIGFPGETWDEIRETLRFAESLDLGLVKIFNATPAINTDLHTLACETGSLKDGMIETDQFRIRDLRTLRAFEWERINFGIARKRERIMKFYDLTEEELNRIRRETLNNVIL